MSQLWLRGKAVSRVMNDKPYNSVFIDKEVSQSLPKMTLHRHCLHILTVTITRSSEKNRQQGRNNQSDGDYLQWGADLNSESPNTDVVSTKFRIFSLFAEESKFSLQCLIEKSMKTYLSRGQKGLPHPGIIFSCNKKGQFYLICYTIYQHVENYSGSWISNYMEDSK